MNIYRGASVASPTGRAGKFRKRKGMTMVMMLILVPIIMLIAVSYVEPIIRSYRAGVNDQKTLLAKSVADSMFEVALWESRGGGTGTVREGCLCETGSCTIGSAECDEGVDYGFGKAQAEWHVFTAPETDNEHLIDIDNNGDGDWYTVPSPGSGDAGGTYCSTNDPVVNVDMLEDVLVLLVGNSAAMGNPAGPFDWPCHWNKIREGESVSIPLYTEDENGVVNNPVDLGLVEFDLRIRAACDPGADPEFYDYQICENGERYGLDENTLPLLDKTVIILWEIVGKNVDENGAQIILSAKRFGPLNSFFDIKNINNYNHSLNYQSFVQDNDPLTADQGLSGFLNNLYKPTLNLQVIHTLKDSQNRTIPYLEYQFKAPLNLSSDKPVSNTSKVVRVDVMLDGGYSETLEKTIALPKPISGFVISQ